MPDTHIGVGCTHTSEIPELTIHHRRFRHFLHCSENSAQHLWHFLPVGLGSVSQIWLTCGALQRHGSHKHQSKMRRLRLQHRAQGWRFCSDSLILCAPAPQSSPPWSNSDMSIQPIAELERTTDKNISISQRCRPHVVYTHKCFIQSEASRNASREMSISEQALKKFLWSVLAPETNFFIANNGDSSKSK